MSACFNQNHVLNDFENEFEVMYDHRSYKYMIFDIFLCIKNEFVSKTHFLQQSLVWSQSVCNGHSALLKGTQPIIRRQQIFN